VKKIKKIIHHILALTFIVEFFLLFYAVFGDMSELPAVQFFFTVVPLIIAIIINVQIGWIKWLLQRTLPELILANALLISLCVNSYESIKKMFIEFKISLGKKLCGESCCDNE